MIKKIDKRALHLGMITVLGCLCIICILGVALSIPGVSPEVSHAKDSYNGSVESVADLYTVKYGKSKTGKFKQVDLSDIKTVKVDQGENLYLVVEKKVFGGEASENEPPILGYREEGSNDKPLKLKADKDGYYELDTAAIGSFEVVLKVDNLDSGIVFKYEDETGVETGIFKDGEYYYYRNEFGLIEKKAGFVEWKGNKYYIQSGGKISTKESFNIGVYTYRSAEDGTIETGVYKWDNAYYYGDNEGRLKLTRGFVEYDGEIYYVQRGGKIIRNNTFKVDGNTYRAGKDGTIYRGAYKWSSKYYFADDTTGALRTKAGAILWNGHRYFAKSDGELYAGEFVFYNSQIYYAGKEAYAMTGEFKVRSNKYVADGDGRIIETDRKHWKGIDVSYFQGKNVDWEKVKKSGVSFAFLRCGFSGSKKGKHKLDSTFFRNAMKATDAGVDVGVYYYTQATSAEEGRAEAEYAIFLVEEAGFTAETMPLPIVIDTEYLRGSRSARLSKSDRTEAVKAFCEYVEDQGYTPMIYASTSWFKNKLDMDQLSNYKVWVAQYSESVSYKGKYQCWQYSDSGSIDGIRTRVDLNYWMP
ncbi:MAG: GH25 family lysozyme [Bacillota bacterium]|nr:GH25 family lysozyme [Bacillota bacterium]